MKKLEKYTGTKTYMFPSGGIASPWEVISQYPAVEVFTHVIETDENREVMYAIMNLSGMRSMYNIDPALTEDEAIAELERLINAPPPEPEYPDDPLAEALDRLADVLENMPGGDPVGVTAGDVLQALLGGYVSET